MKLTRLAPLAVALLTLAGSAAFAQNVQFGYNVLTQPAILPGSPLQQTVIDNACGSCGVMTQPAVLAAPACGSCGVLEQPAVVGGPVAPTIINQPMFLQGTNPYDISVFAGQAIEQTAATTAAPLPAPIAQPPMRRVFTHRRVLKARHHHARPCLRRR